AGRSCDRSDAGGTDTGATTMGSHCGASTTGNTPSRVTISRVLISEARGGAAFSPVADAAGVFDEGESPSFEGGDTEAEPEAGLVAGPLADAITVGAALVS